MEQEKIDLIRLAMAGNETAFEELYRSSLRMILYTATQICGSAQDAEDIAQEVGLTMHRKIATL